MLELVDTKKPKLDTVLKIEIALGEKETNDDIVRSNPLCKRCIDTGWKLERP